MALKFLPLWILISLCTLRIFLFLDNDMQDMICDENDPLPINTPSLKKSSKGCPWHNEAGLHLPWPINFHLNWWFYSWASRFTSHHKQPSRPSTQNRYLEDRAIDFYRTRCLWGPVYGYRCLYVTPYKSFGWDFADVTLAGDYINSILNVNRIIMGWWSSFRWWSSPMSARRSPRGRGSARNIGAGVLVSCDHVGDNICCWTIGR